jgi:hypothetical protein
VVKGLTRAEKEIALAESTINQIKQAIKTNSHVALLS